MKHLHEFIQKLGTKQQWGLKELRSELGQVITKEAEEKQKKILKISSLQKYDLVYLSLYGGVPHYILVEKVKDDKVFGIVLSSKEGIHNLKPIEKDRVLKGGWFSNTYCLLDLQTALEKFVRVYENKSEANQVFRMIKQTYHPLFSNKKKTS